MYTLAHSPLKGHARQCTPWHTHQCHHCTRTRMHVSVHLGYAFCSHFGAKQWHIFVNSTLDACSEICDIANVAHVIFALSCIRLHPVPIVRFFQATVAIQTITIIMVLHRLRLCGGFCRLYTKNMRTIKRMHKAATLDCERGVAGHHASMFRCTAKKNFPAALNVSNARDGITFEYPFASSGSTEFIRSAPNKNGFASEAV